MIYTFLPMVLLKYMETWLLTFAFFIAGRWVGEGVKLVRTLTDVKRILGMTAAQEMKEMVIRTRQVEMVFHWGHDL